MSDVALVGLVSSYLEGRLIRGAVGSLVTACDAVYVFEGPAGDPIEAAVPPTDLGALAALENVHVHEGRWRTDARKRSDILARVKPRHEAPVWGIWVDGDEVLFNADYLRDWLQILQWHDELNGGEPHLGRPIRVVELDGSVGWMRGRVIRLDLVERYEISNAMFVNAHGFVQGAGHVPDSYSDWRLPRQPYWDGDQVVMPPPISGEPHVLHRSVLRHPLRAGNRMHQQEAEQIAARKAELEAQPAGGLVLPPGVAR